MKNKKHILIFIDWYLPGYKAGGPIRSCANLVARLKPFYDFSIVTRDTDFGEKEPYQNIKSNEWLEVEHGVRAYYISTDQMNGATVKKLMKGNYDVLYLNSLFSYFFTIIPLAFNKKIPHVVVAPRGMLGQGALSIKPFKKQLFLKTSRLMRLYSDVTWQASTELESEEIKNVFGKNAKVINALNLPPFKKLTYAPKIKVQNA